jgi:two-component system, OmpR family, phosphate regulon sensor histidine kinase PhoR
VKPKTIRYVILLMSISLIGIVGVQIFWMLNAVKINEEHFNRNVNEALNELIGKIETKETCKMITTNACSVNSDERDMNEALNIIPDIMNSIGIPMPSNKVIIRPKDISDTTKTIIRLKTFDKMGISDKSDTITEKSKIRTVLTLRDDTTKNIKLTFVSNNKIDVKTEKFRDVVEKILVEYEINNKSLASRLKQMNFQKLLKEALIKHAIYLPYEYRVANNDTKDTASSSAGYDDNYKGNSYRVILFPNDIVEKSDYLKLYFPGKSRFIYQSLSLMMTGSALFTLIILLTFIYTIFVILRQKKISEIKNDFINNMTHEFKTPIATISLASDSISSPLVLDNKELIQYFSGVIKEESMRMNTKVERVLQLSLLDKNNISFAMNRIHVHDIIDTAIEKIHLQLDQRSGEISTSLLAENCTIEADAEHFMSVLLNILDNAMKYSPDAPVIHISTFNKNQNLCIAISDKGIGIAKEDSHKIFERFYRVNTGNVHNVKGFGLGLSYVKEIITAFNGTVSVISQKGQGSTFTISFPLVS